MDAVSDYEGLCLWYAVHQDRPSARGCSYNNEPVSLHQIQRVKSSRIEKCEFMVTCSRAVYIYWPIRRIVHDRKLLRDNHDALAVLGSLDDPASQQDFDP